MSTIYVFYPDEYIDEYIETEIKNSRSNATYIDYRNAINSLKLYTGFKDKKIKFEDVNYSLLDKFKRNSKDESIEICTGYKNMFKLFI